MQDQTIGGKDASLFLFRAPPTILYCPRESWIRPRWASLRPPRVRVTGRRAQSTDLSALVQLLSRSRQCAQVRGSISDDLLFELMRYEC